MFLHDVKQRQVCFCHHAVSRFNNQDWWAWLFLRGKPSDFKSEFQGHLLFPTKVWSYLGTNEPLTSWTPFFLTFCPDQVTSYKIHILGVSQFLVKKKGWQWKSWKILEEFWSQHGLIYHPKNKFCLEFWSDNQNER